MSDRILMQLGVIGATHQAESVIALLNGSTLSLRQLGRDGFHDAISDAVTIAYALLSTVEKLRDENWQARCDEIDAGRVVVVPHPRANVTRLPIRQNERA